MVCIPQTENIRPCIALCKVGVLAERLRARMSDPPPSKANTRYTPPTPAVRPSAGRPRQQLDAALEEDAAEFFQGVLSREAEAQSQSASPKILPGPPSRGDSSNVSERAAQAG